MKQIRFFIVPANVEIGRLEDVSQFIADQVYDGMKVQFGGQALLDGIDKLQLGHTFLLGFEEALRFIEEARVF